jgi:hypothetical protein
MQWSFSLSNFGVHLSFQSWRWCLRCCSVVVSAKGTYKVEQNCTHTHKKTHQVSEVQMQYGFSKFFSMQVQFSCFLIKGRERGKKESGDNSENGICSCGLPAGCCQPAVAGGVIYADLWGELSSHLAPQALFTQSSPVREPLLQAFPFPSTGKGDTAPAFSGLYV